MLHLLLLIIYLVSKLTFNIDVLFEMLGIVGRREAQVEDAGDCAC